jgi:putative Holliday junction resolvase
MNRSLGIDIGDARVGVAISDELNFLAHPLETIEVRRTEPVPRIAALAAERGAGTIVIGLPRNMDGSRGPAAEKAEKFAEAVRAALPDRRVVLWDERLTTVSAQRSLREAGRKAHEQRGVIDQAAAQVILQGWLDAQAGGSTML